MNKPQPSTLSGAFNQPFTHQVAFFRNKMGNLVPTARWDDLRREQHDIGFMVAGAQKADLLADLAAAVERTITEGKGLEAFRKDFKEIVERHGWHGWTGEDSAAGWAWRTKVIYQTNLNTAYAAGRYAQLLEGNFAFWVYKHSETAQNPRPHHLAWNDMALPPEHEFWQTHYPPNGWGCGCYVVGTRSERGIRRLGGDPDKQPTEADLTSHGIDQGWDYAPGASLNNTVQQMAEKTRQWDYELAKAYMQEVPEGVRDQLAQSYRALPSVADDTRRYARSVLQELKDTRIAPYRTMGLLTEADAVAVSQLKSMDVKGFDFALDASSVKHVNKHHGNDKSESKRGQRGVTEDDYALLPQLLNSQDSWEDFGVSDMTNAPLVGKKLRVGGNTHVAVLELRKGRKMLSLMTYYILGR